MSFENLVKDLEDLDELRKSQASVEGEGNTDGGEGDVTVDADADADEYLGKSFSLKLENGEELEAIDGTALVKSLMSRMDDQELTHKEQADTLQKAMGLAVDLIKSQGADIDNLKQQVQAIGSSGAGRKTTVSIAEKPEIGQLQKSEPTGMSGKEFLAKAESAMMSGRISGQDLAIVEASLNRGVPVRDDIKDRVFG